MIYIKHLDGTTTTLTVTNLVEMVSSLPDKDYFEFINQLTQTTRDQANEVHQHEQHTATISGIFSH